MESRFHRVTAARGAVRFAEALASEATAGCTVRAARMLAVAHALADMIARGETSRVELARALRMSGGRLSQLLDLVLLAPDIQEDLLLLEAGTGSAAIPERALRHVVRALAWAEQRRRWAALRAHGGRGTRHEPWAGRPRAGTPKKEEIGCRKLAKGYVEAT
jgi:hypothetical protein